MLSSYPAKILLIGEYTVLQGSAAIGVPYTRQYGKWQKSTVSDSDTLDSAFWQYLYAHCLDFLDKAKIELLRDGQWTFVSNIKRGYGSGSSGALTAAVYDFARQEDDACRASQLTLQAQLACIESYFHGKSSGFDPLISYRQSPLLRTSDGDIQVLDTFTSDPHWYILDSGVSRGDNKLIDQYLSFAKHNPSIAQRMASLNTEIITHMLQKQSYVELLQELSKLQYEYMQPMITDSVKGLWEASLTDQRYTIKLCGAGGGGYYLVYATEMPDDMALGYMPLY